MTTQQSGDGVCRSAPAKVNLTLGVLGRRSDGFHELHSLVVGVGLADTVRVVGCEGGEIALACDRPGIPLGEGNLVVRAARLLAERTGVARRARIELSKVVPAGGGLGGGSSDAAATLDALNVLWSLGLTETDLMALGAEIGSDVPLFFRLPAVLVRGRGEIVESVRFAWSGWMVLIFGGMEVSTKAVYARWRRHEGRRPEHERAAEAILRATTADEIRPLLFNDLEPAVFGVCPSVERLRARVRELGGAHARISGAGSTVYTIHDDVEEANAFADTVRRAALGAGVAVVRAPSGHAVTTTT